VHLRYHEGGGPGDADLMASGIGRVECAHDHRLIVDNCGLKSSSPSHRMVVVRRYPSSAGPLTAATGECLGDHEVNRDAVRIEPRAGLVLLRIGVEAARSIAFSISGSFWRVRGSIARSLSFVASATATAAPAVWR
jgi:hypothetical protein